MRIVIKYILAVLVLVSLNNVIAQTKEGLEIENTLSFEEFLGFVKQHHPLLKQAELTLSIGEANLLKARGGFDPKIEVDYDRKKFKKTEYYDQLNATFKIPTWYGIEFKANFEEHTGEFLNPNLTVPEDGLYSAGVSFSLAEGFLTNQRMATLRKAKFFREQTKADRDLLISNLLYDASKAYFTWLQATKEQEIFSIFLENATVRLEAVKRSAEVGDKALIDVTEAEITAQNRALNLEAARLKVRKAALIVSNYLWLNDIPMELLPNVAPVSPETQTIKTSLGLNKALGEDSVFSVESHPKLLSLDAKISGLTVDKRLKINELLPKVDLQYNFLTPSIEQLNNFNTANYKAFVNFSMPVFLRKERGALKLANIKLQNANFDRMSASLTIQNKVNAVNAEISSLETQNDLIINIVENYDKLVKAEERKFSLGESSLFLINSREQKLIDAQLKENELVIKALNAYAKLYNTLGLSI